MAKGPRNNSNRYRGTAREEETIGDKVAYGIISLGESAYNLKNVVEDSAKNAYNALEDSVTEYFEPEANNEAALTTDDQKILEADD